MLDRGGDKIAADFELGSNTCRGSVDAHGGL